MVRTVWRKTLNEDRLKVFVGYDTREDVAWQVCKHSPNLRNKNVDVIPLKLTELREQGWYKRDTDKLGSTEFTFSRFLILNLQILAAGLCFVTAILYSRRCAKFI